LLQIEYGRERCFSFGAKIFPHRNPLPEDGAREMMEHQLMTAQIRVHDLDLDGILAQVVPENLSQPVTQAVAKSSPTAVGVSER
jgi:hypothetical protein